MLGAAIVHPDRKAVIPLAPEPIIKQDGATKNDCERNASRRFLERFRRDHPRLPVIVTEDALSGNGPHLDDLRAADARYIIGVKPGDHTYLFAQVQAAEDAGQLQTLTLEDEATGVLHHFRWQQQLPLNERRADLRVNFLDYWEIHPTRVVKKVRRAGKVQHFSWITDLAVTSENVVEIMRGGRARWKIENETFNTLKNQGYNLEHNYGHGTQNLSVVLMMLMLLAFLVDQVQQLCCPKFQAAWQKCWKNKRALWEELRNLFRAFLFASMAALLEAIARRVPPQAVAAPNTS